MRGRCSAEAGRDRLPLTRIFTSWYRSSAIRVCSVRQGRFVWPQLPPDVSSRVPIWRDGIRWARPIRPRTMGRLSATVRPAVVGWCSIARTRTRVLCRVPLQGCLRYRGLLRMAKTADGWTVLTPSVKGDRVEAENLTLDATGNIVSRQKLTGCGGHVSLCSSDA